MHILSTLTECDQVEERNPSSRGQEVLSKGHTQGRNNPRDLLHRQETVLDVGLQLGRGTNTSHDSHGSQVDYTLFPLVSNDTALTKQCTNLSS